MWERCERAKETELFRIADRESFGVFGGFDDVRLVDVCDFILGTKDEVLALRMIVVFLEDLHFCTPLLMNTCFCVSESPPMPLCTPCIPSRYRGRVVGHPFHLLELDVITRAQQMPVDSMQIQL